MFQMLKRLFSALVSTVRVTPGVIPTSADTVAAVAITITSAGGAWTWGAWIQMLTAAANTAERQITGFSLENFVGAASQGEVQIGTGAGGAEVVKATFPAVGALYQLPTPLTIPTATRIACRYRTSTGAADTVDIKLMDQTGV